MPNVKDQLKRVAAQTVQRSGVPSVTMRDLGEAVGIKSSSVMYHFGSKDGLLFEIASDYVAEQSRRLSAVAKSRKSPREKIGALVAIFEEALAGDQICLCGMLAVEEKLLDEKTRSVVRGFFSLLERWVAGVLRESAGSLTSPQARDEARVIVSSLQGALMLDKAEGRPTRLRSVKKHIQRSL